MSGWRAGAATIPFPVDPGTSMAGYMARSGPSIGTHDELTINALWLNDESANLAILTADIAAIDSELVDEIALSAGLARSELVVCASHTHSGPAGVIKRMHPADDDRLNLDLRADFTARCARAIAGARTHLEPVELLFGSVPTSSLSANRNELDGPFDSYLSVLATRRSDSVVTAALVQFACHPTILGAANLAVSADFPGTLRRALIANGTTPVVLFANGAAGDVSTRFIREAQDFDEVERIGSALAVAAEEAIKTARNVSGSIQHLRRRVNLPVRSLSDPEPLAPMSRCVDKARSPAERRKLETRVQGAVMLRRLAAADPAAIRSEFDLVAWKVGDINLVAVPGELFAALGARIQSASPSPTVILGYANGYVGYLADGAAYESGTYEALASPFAPGSGEQFAEIARDLVQRLDESDESDSNRD
jgi:hypothetical protein